MASYGSLVINDGVGDGSSPGLSSFSLNISCSSPPVFVGSAPKRTIRHSSMEESTDTRPGQSVSFRLAHDRVVAGSLSGRIVLDGSAIQTFAVDIGGNFSFSDIGEQPSKVSSGSLDLASGVVSLFYGSASSSSSSEVLQTSLIVDYIYEETVSSFRMTNTFSKRIDRIASSKNPMKAAKSAVAEYAGCREASMVRKRAVALSRIRLSISGEEFRFRLP